MSAKDRKNPSFFRRPFLYLLGGRRIEVDAARRVEFLNLCFRNGFAHAGISFDEVGNIVVIFPIFSAIKAKKLCEKHSIPIRVGDRIGLPSLLFRLRRRLGLCVGACLACLLVILSGRFLWDVRVTGNEAVSDGEIRSILSDCGLSVGARIGEIDPAEIELNALLATDRLSWISVTIEGTVARVQVIENTPPPPAEPTSPANLVAECDGEIVYLELLRGTPVVTAGQAVKKGDLLVSGLRDSATLGIVSERAAGRVMAKTERVFHIEVPLERTEKCYGEAQILGIEVNFFGFSRKIYKKDRTAGASCDIIKTEINADAAGLADLPFGAVLVKAIPYTERVVAIGREEAEEIAYARLEEEILSVGGEAFLLRKRVRVTLGETALVLDCTATLIADIAKTVEIGVG